MRKSTYLAFDDVISGTTVVYTSTAANDRLGLHNQLGLFVVIDNVVGTTPTFDLWIEHSCDGRNWLQRNDTTMACPPPETAGTGDIKLTTSAAGVTYVQAYTDPAVTAVYKNGVTGALAPLLSYVRFGMKTSASASMHVKIHVVQRD